MMFHQQSEQEVFERRLFDCLSTKEWLSTATLQRVAPSKIAGIHYRILMKFVRRNVLETRLVQGRTKEREWKLKWRAEP